MGNEMIEFLLDQRPAAPVREVTAAEVAEWVGGAPAPVDEPVTPEAFAAAVKTFLETQ